MHFFPALVLSFVVGLIVSAIVKKPGKSFSWPAFWITLLLALGVIQLILGLVFGAFVGIAFLSLALIVLLIKVGFYVALALLIIWIFKRLIRPKKTP